MNNPFKVMYDEHEIIVKAEEVINNLEGIWENNPKKFKLSVNELVEFFRDYADGYHHRKEEDVLFPAIKNHPDFVLQEIIDEFEEHHESFRAFAREIIVYNNEGNYAKAHKVLKHYINDLLDHIAAENEELFVLADNLFSDNEKKTIYFKFMDIDMELGESHKKELEKLIDGLKLKKSKSFSSFT